MSERPESEGAVPHATTELIDAWHAAGRLERRAEAGRFEADRAHAEAQSVRIEAERALYARLEADGLTGEAGLVRGDLILWAEGGRVRWMRARPAE